jgi:dsDNA-specific endonuclease/ATPase MutS2
MKVGDKVRLLRGTEEGRIINIKNDKIVEVEIEDGFVIPALKNEVVVVDRSEAENFKIEDNSPDDTVKENSTKIPEGLYLGFKEMDQGNFEGYFLNQTTHSVLYTISQSDKKIYRGKSFGICDKYEANQIGIFTSSIFNDSKRIHIQILIHEVESRLKKSPLNMAVNITKDQLSKKEFLNSISEEVALIRLDENKPVTIDPDALRTRMMSGTKLASNQNKPQQLSGESTIDLHLDLRADTINPDEVLDHQLNEFEKAYDNALVMNLGKLKVIHGIGAGILRNEIHKRLSKKPEVKYFEDADKERFGFGSTIIYF